MDIEKFLASPDERPLDRIADDGGFCGIFRTIGCIGDSLSSGEFESLDEKGKKHYHDLYEYSWGQYIARMIGSKVYNFSRGGMTAHEYWNKFSIEKDFWNPDKLCQAYIIALGANDIINGRTPAVGSMDDINLEDYNKNGESFVGYYARIIQKLKEMQPRAKFFLVTLADSAGLYGSKETVDMHAELLYGMAEKFDNTYVLDIRKYGPVYDRAFRDKFYLGGHMNPMGYMFTAKMIASYIDYIIRHNTRDFVEVGFIGTNLTNFGKK